MSQSSNDTFPTAMHIAAAREIEHAAAAGAAAPARRRSTTRRRPSTDIVKIGRTHTAGRDAADARPGVLRLRRAGRARHRARRGDAAAALCSWRRAAPRSAPASTRQPGFAETFAERDRRAHRPAVHHRAEQVRGAGRARRHGVQLTARSTRVAAGAVQDRQRHPLARLAARARASASCRCRRTSRAPRSCRARSTRPSARR